MGRRLGQRSAPFFWGGGTGFPSETMWPGPRPTCMPSFVLIHRTVWPQYTNVTDVTQLPLPEDGVEPPIFGPRLLWPNGWTDQDATWHGSRSRPRPHFTRWGPSSPPQKGGRFELSRHVEIGRTCLYVVADRLAAGLRQIALRYPGRRPGRGPAASWILAYHALSSSLAAS